MLKVCGVNDSQLHLILDQCLQMDQIIAISFFHMSDGIVAAIFNWNGLKIMNY